MPSNLIKRIHPRYNHHTPKPPTIRATYFCTVTTRPHIDTRINLTRPIREKTQPIHRVFPAAVKNPAVVGSGVLSEFHALVDAGDYGFATDVLALAGGAFEGGYVGELVVAGGELGGGGCNDRHTPNVPRVRKTKYPLVISLPGIIIMVLTLAIRKQTQTTYRDIAAAVVNAGEIGTGRLTEGKAVMRSGGDGGFGADVCALAGGAFEGGYIGVFVVAGGELGAEGAFCGVGRVICGEQGEDAGEEGEDEGDGDVHFENC